MSAELTQAELAAQLYAEAFKAGQRSAFEEAAKVADERSRRWAIMRSIQATYSAEALREIAAAIRSKA